MSPAKVKTIAEAEFGMLVRTRAFLITVLLMPVLVIGSIAVQKLVAKQVDTTPRKVALIDRAGGEMLPELQQLTDARNRGVQAGIIPGALFEIEVVPGAADPEASLALSERVRKGEIFAFAEIPADIYDAKAGAKLQYYSDHPTYEDLRQWLELTANEVVRKHRLRAAGVDPDTVAMLDVHVPSEHNGLLTRGPNGEIMRAEKVDVVQTYVLPLGLMYILFLTIFMSAPQLMNSVMQEKMSKISEVLLGSVSPFEIMLGKLIGSAGMSVVLAVLYLGGGISVAIYSGYGNLITPELFVYFVIFMVLAVLFFGSIFIAIGAACTDLKDAQSLMTPVMLVVLLPMFAWQAVLKSPGSPFAIGVSMFPPSTPFLMLLRLALHPGPAWWQVVGSIVLTGAMTLGCVWAAGKVFRVGMLMTGKSASLLEMIRWTLAK